MFLTTNHPNDRITLNSVECLSALESPLDQIGLILT